MADAERFGEELKENLLIKHKHFFLVCLPPSPSRLVLAELVSDRFLSLQPRPHPLLQGVLRPPLLGRLCLRVTLQRTEDEKEETNY